MIDDDDGGRWQSLWVVGVNLAMDGWKRTEPVGWWGATPMSGSFAEKKTKSDKPQWEHTRGNDSERRPTSTKNILGSCLTR